MIAKGAMPRPKVAILIVTHNEAADLPACFASIRHQTHRPLEVVVVDCASRDESLEVARSADLGDIPKQVIDAGANLGFAGGMNTAMAHSDAPSVLTLNADVRLGPSYVAELLPYVLDSRQRAGAATGRLLRFLQAGERERLDACGMKLETSWRHVDRGAGEIDGGQYEIPERVFGATGAAALFAREALDDVKWPEALFAEPEPDRPAADLIFDPDFFAFREDAELAFRLQARGWNVVYVPSARARHRRNNLPDRRQRMPALINYHGVKNRFLLRAYHQTLRGTLRTLVPTLVRDLLVAGYLLVRERSSLPAFGWLWRHRRMIRARRRHVQSRKRVSVGVWFERDAAKLTGPTPEAAGDG